MTDAQLPPSPRLLFTSDRVQAQDPPRTHTHRARTGERCRAAPEPSSPAAAAAAGAQEEETAARGTAGKAERSGAERSYTGLI